MTDTPPDWVLIEAAKRSEFLPSAEFRLKNYCELPVFRALCDMIQKYEQPPMDRKLLCAREAWEQLGAWQGEVDSNWVAIRAIELWEEGFGSE